MHSQSVRITTNTVFFFLLVVTIFILFQNSLNSIHTEACLIMLLILLGQVLIKKLSLTKNESILVILSLIFSAIIVTYWLIGISSAEFDRFSGYLNWIIIIFCSMYVQNNFEIRQKINLFYIILIAGLISTVTLIVKSFSITNIYYRYTLIDNAAFGSMIMLYGGACFVYFIHCKNAFRKALSISAALLSMYLTVFVLQRAINFILFFLMIALIILFNSKNRKVAILTIFIISMVLYYLIYSGVLALLLEGAVSSLKLDHRLTTRVNSVIVYLRTKNVDQAGGFSNRYYLLSNTLNTWRSSLNSFLFGVGDHRATNEIIGNHNELIDMLARFGLFGTGILYFCFIFQYRLFGEYCNSYTYAFLSQCRVIFAIYVIRNFLGSAMTSQIAVIIFLMLPLMSTVLHYSNKKEINSETDF